MNIKRILKTEKIQLKIISVILVIGLLLIVFSVLPLSMEPGVLTSCMGCTDRFFPGYNKTIELGTVDHYTHRTFYFEVIYQDYPSPKEPSKTGIYYFVFESSNPAKKRMEGVAGQNEIFVDKMITIKEPGNWFIVLEYYGNETISCMYHFGNLKYIDKPILDEIHFKGGAIMIAYSIIALIIFLHFSRAAKIRKRKAALLPNSKKQ